VSAKHIAFLRGINVGGHAVKMTELRVTFERMGFDNVETFIASGNVIFDTNTRSTAALERTIERGLREAFGFDVATFVRSPEELVAVAAHTPFSSKAAAGWKSLYVCFLKQPLSTASARTLKSLATDADQFSTARREVYWLCRENLTGSLVKPAALARALGSNTQRNINTVQRLAAKYPAS
jgi:uncharacterized protein (DUF1697 family)